jgi:hypothetical protein
MPKIQLPITNGFYKSRSLPISSQNCVNLYPVIKNTPALVQQSLRGTPGVEWILTNAITGEAYDGGPVVGGGGGPDGTETQGGVDGGGGGDNPDAGGFEPGEDIPPILVDPRIECQPYDCEAFGDVLTEVYGGDVTGLNTSFSTATTAANLGDTKAVVDDIAAGIGFTLQINKQSAADSSNAFQIVEVPLDAIDPCEAGIYDNALSVFKGTVASQGELVLLGPVDANIDVVVVARSRRESPNNSLSDTGSGNTQCIGKTINVDFVSNNVNNNTQAFNQTLYIEDDTSAKTATFKVQINGRRSGSATTGSEIVDVGTIALDPDVAAWSNWTLIQFQVKNFVLEVVADWVVPTRSRVKLTRTFSCKVGYIGADGDPQVLDVSETYECYTGAFSGGIQSAEVRATSTGIPVFATKSDVLIAGLYAKDAPVDLEDLFLAYRRNLTTYTPPDDCVFITP